MSLSSGGWTHTPPPAQPPSSHLGHEASQSGCNTVLMSVKVSVCHSGIRPLCLPGAGDESLRLQLSMDPGKAGEFRLTLRDVSGAAAGRSVVSWHVNLHVHTLSSAFNTSYITWGYMASSWFYFESLYVIICSWSRVCSHELVTCCFGCLCC